MIAATEDYDINIYEKTTGERRSTLTGGGQTAPTGAIACNPKYDVLATGNDNTVLWIRSPDNTETHSHQS